MGKTPKQKYIITKKNASCNGNDETTCLKSFDQWTHGERFEHCIKLREDDAKNITPDADTFYCPINSTDSSLHNEIKYRHRYAICQDITNCKRHCHTFPKHDNKVGSICTKKPGNHCRYVNPEGIWLQGLRCEKFDAWIKCMPDCLSWKLSGCESSNIFHKYDHSCKNTSKSSSNLVQNTLCCRNISL